MQELLGKAYGGMVGEGLIAHTETMFQRRHRVWDCTLSRSSFRIYVEDVRRRVGVLLREGEECAHPKTAQTCKSLLKVEAASRTFVRRETVKQKSNAGRAYGAFEGVMARGESEHEGVILWRG